MISITTVPAVVLRRGLLAAAAVTAALVLSACGGGHGSSAGSGMDHGGKGATTAASANAAGVNASDVMFAQMMIVHHRQAIEMAELADTRAADPEVKSLATTVKKAQQPEIDTMIGWLTAWGRPAPMPGSSAAAMDTSAMNHGSMPGVMSDTDMKKLTDSTGTAFDRQFLTMMIAHHEGAVTMAQEETAGGADPGATALAAKIITDQRAEITTMQGILERLS